MGILLCCERKYESDIIAKNTSSFNIKQSIYESNNKDKIICIVNNVNSLDNNKTGKTMASGDSSQLKKKLSCSTEHHVWEGFSKRPSPQEHYVKVQALGIGAYGKVFKVKNIHTSQFRALKVIDKNIESKLTLNQISDELKLLKNLDHPNIIQVYESFEDDLHFFIVSELCGEGDLLTKLNKVQHFTECQAKYIIKQILSALAYIHNKNIVHCDIKLENIMVEETIQDVENKQINFEVKLIDFGCARFLIANQSKKMTEIVGTSLYLAPEVISGDHDEKCDIWSVGIILYTLLTSEYPFSGCNDKDIFEKILKGDINYNNEGLNKVSSEGIKLLKKLLTVDSKQRISARDALHDIWFTLTHDVVVHERLLKVKSSTKEFMKILINHEKEYNFQHLVKLYFTHNFCCKENLHKLRDVFKYIDADEDGKISREDLQSYYKSEDDNLSHKCDIENIIRLIDFKGEGFIEYEEFIEATFDIKAVLNEQNLEATYTLIDADNRNFIFLEEIVDYFILGKKIGQTIKKEYIDELLLEGLDSEEEIDFEKFKACIISLCSRKRRYS